MNGPESKRSTRIKQWMFLITGIAALALLLSACQGSTEAGGEIDLNGTIDAREVPVAFQVGGRLQKLKADEGDKVMSGASVAELDAADYQLAVQRAEAEAEAAKQALAALEAGTRTQELRVAEAAVAKAKSELSFAESEVKRIDTLLAKKLAAQEQLDQAQLRYDVAWSTRDQAEHQLDLLKEGPRREDIDRARAELAARRAAVAGARRQLTYCDLASPVKGVVSLRQAEVGQVVGAGQPVLKISELGRPWVRAYLREPDLPRVRLGQSAEVRVDGLPGKVFAGKVAFISPEAEFTPKTVETRELRVDLVYLIKVEVDNPDGLLKIGMPADVKIGS
ncbi:MAG: HlyD family efflux transporter periplasmic adaptor subunit [Gammaproteobacteria bacterium]|nr:HlyD family efflux transporter periplasmic adaptor subunit [Gammaproteobacteria bacterium]